MRTSIVVSLMAGVRPEEARTIGWEEDVDLYGNPPSVVVLRADRAGGDTKTRGAADATWSKLVTIWPDGSAASATAWAPSAC